MYEISSLDTKVYIKNFNYYFLFVRIDPNSNRHIIVGKYESLNTSTSITKIQYTFFNSFLFQ